MLAQPVKDIVESPIPVPNFDSLAPGRASVGAENNIVDKKHLRKVQLKTLDTIENSLACTFGPAASSTVILTGGDANTLVANYSKDGRKCLKHLMFSNPIELSIRTQLDDIVSHVDQEVGDGTTSATMLSAEIFKQLCAMEEEKGKAAIPYKISRTFKKTVSMIQNNIKKRSRELTLDDVYKIAYISTNGNDDIAKMIYDVYKEYGLDCYIEVGISNTEEDQIKIYDGLTLDEGYSDPAYINSREGTASIRNANVYVFEDPIDTEEMGVLLAKIIQDNIIEPEMNGAFVDEVPTVIMAPKISRDMAETISHLVEYLYQFDAKNDLSSKPPILIVTNLGSYLDQYLDIGRLCGAKFIKKYIDPKIQKQDIEKGLAPTPTTIHNFAGKCELVESNISMTKFINPSEMYQRDEEGNIMYDESDSPVLTPTFSNLVTFLEAQIEDAKKNNEDDKTIFELKRRLQSLKANMVEIEVGGITISDRDETKDLVEDAVKSCRSAAKSGVGYGANFEGFRAATEIVGLQGQVALDQDVIDMAVVISRAYSTVLKRLYSSIITDEKTVKKKILESLDCGSPLNLVKMEFSKDVLTSIDTDIKILDAISKIVTLMFTTEQCYVQVPALNHYID